MSQQNTAFVRRELAADLRSLYGVKVYLRPKRCECGHYVTKRTPDGKLCLECVLKGRVKQ